MLVFLAYGDNIYVENSDSFVGCAILLLLYGYSSIPLSYVYSYYFENHSTAQIGIATANFVTGWVMVVADFILALTEKTKDVNASLQYVYRAFPHYNLGKGLITLSMKSFTDRLTGKETSCFDWEVLRHTVLPAAMCRPRCVLSPLAVLGAGGAHVLHAVGGPGLLPAGAPH